MDFADVCALIMCIFNKKGRGLMLSLINICKVFNIGTVDENKLFSNFNLTIDEGEFISVIGSNGSGKTTLLNLICGTM